MSRPDPADRSFRVWVRRQLDAATPYSLRFEVSDGKGILRVTRPGVLIDPPARPMGEEQGLIGPQVRASRFLHAREGGRARAVWGFVRLEDHALEHLPVDLWVELDPEVDGPNQQMVVRLGLPSVEEHPPGDETTSPQRMLEELRDELSNPRAPAPVEVAEEPTPAAVPTPVPPAAEEEGLAGWGTDIEVREAPARPEPAAPTEVIVAGDEPEDEDEELDADPDDVADALVPDPTPPEAVAARAAVDPGDVWRFHARRTTLVRFFRRRIQDEQLRVMELEARLAAMGGRPA